MNFQSIRIRYTSLFCSVALIFVIFIILNSLLISKTKNALMMLGNTFNPAISAVINADRDLYQARVANLLALDINSRVNYSEQKATFDENAQQALDRMNNYQQLMSSYPDIISSINGFQATYNKWLTTSNKIFALIKENKYDEAKELSETQALNLFESLREFYDKAGEAADNKSSLVSKQTIDHVESQQTVLMVISALIIIITLVVGFMGPKALANALIELSKQIKMLNSGDGDLTRRINSKRADEVGQVANDFDQLVSDLGGLIGTILNQSSKVIEGVESLNQGVEKVTINNQQQSESVEIIVTAVNEMSYAIKDVAHNAQLTTTELEQVNTLTREGIEITNNSVKEIENLSVTIEDAANVIAKLSEKSDEIASVVDVIRGIAEQTNLLALNAAIEAARAGEQGRGFAVVADEVRTLASRTQESTQNIQQIIESLHSGVKQAVSSINVGSDASKTTVELASGTLKALDEIAAACQKVSDVAIQTATATEEQSQVANDISENLTKLSENTLVSFTVSKQNEEVSSQTYNDANDLSKLVTRFKLI
ncbi:methyl-accepting chemotaxis protein [Pseudoalteromonas sp. G4]|uniref:methyl-accepting chemotaxis protein n=1 Tax=Pseudoalteromonas sp. G4 TaxID=2992761 RepID=UPI00237ED766|nr:methyl-accepting chemotaxis protein [Pseudoalteromonas sp. G4]MDE3271832.1 methyl-accepting chemotaxis protein [Pseudoalteromonas sp. G4]